MATPIRPQLAQQAVLSGTQLNPQLRGLLAMWHHKVGGPRVYRSGQGKARIDEREDTNRLMTPSHELEEHLKRAAEPIAQPEE